MDSIIKEAEKARAKYGPMNSTHELYAVLKEELEEFWDEVKKPTIIVLTPSGIPSENDREYLNEKSKRMIEELTQLCSVAYRGIKELENDQIKFV